MHKISTRERAIQLRKEGYTYKHISETVGLSMSTLSGWLANIPYTPNSETVAALGKARAAAGERKSAIRQESLEEIKKEAEGEIGEISTRDLFMFGLGLYLGEGSKTNGIVRIVNADPKVICIAIAWFISLGLTLKNFAITLHLYPDSKVEECLQFWATATNIPRSQFGKVHIDRRTDKRVQKSEKLPYGTAHLGVRTHGNKEFGVILSRKILAWMDQIAKEITEAGLV